MFRKSHLNLNNPKETTKTMSELGKVAFLEYFSAPHGCSTVKVKCECGSIQYIYVWRGVKKCECGKILSVRHSPEGKDIIVTPEDLGIVKQRPLNVTAFCTSCGREIVYVHGIGWKHSPATVEDSKEDHPALPVPDKIRSRR